MASELSSTCKLESQSDSKLGRVVHTCNPGTWKGKQKDREFMTCLGYTAETSWDYRSPCANKQTNRINPGWEGRCE